jgi:autoinducer 2-degrading protein
MYVTLVHVRVKPESLDAFTEACRNNHLGSVREPGNRRFDILQSAADPACFVLYEAYASAADAAAHKRTPHYLEWRDTVADMMAEPRRGDTYTGLFPKGANA